MAKQLDGPAYSRVMGDELRRLRKQRGLTREALNELLPGKRSLQTLATHELGTRQCTLIRFVEICLALGEQPHQVLECVHNRALPPDRPAGLTINLRAAARCSVPALLPLRRWAAVRLAEPSGPSSVRLDAAAIDALVRLCDLGRPTLITHVKQLAAEAVPLR